MQDTSINLVGEMPPDVASSLVDIVFMTLFVYDDRTSREAVDYIVIKALGEDAFMKSFAARLVQFVEKQLKARTPFCCYRLLKWSFMLLRWSRFTIVSKNGFSKIATLQSSLLCTLSQGPLRVHRASRRAFFQFITEVQDVYKLYMEELKDSRLSLGDGAGMIELLLDYSTRTPSILEQYKASQDCYILTKSSHIPFHFLLLQTLFVDLYVKMVLSAREKPQKFVSEAFCPLFKHLTHEDFRTIVLPASIKMLKRSPELVLESIGLLLKSVNLDLSKYTTDLLPVVLQQARHSDEGRRAEATAIVGYMSHKCSNPDVAAIMFKSISSIISGSEGKLTFPYQRIGMFKSLQELSKFPGGKMMDNVASSVCSFLVSSYKEDGSEEVKIAILAAMSCWAARSAEVIKSDVISFLANGLKEKEALRRAYLRCLRNMLKNPDAPVKVQNLLEPLVQLVKTGFTKPTQRLDGIYALLLLGKMVSLDAKSEEIVLKEKMWQVVSQNDASVVPLSLAMKLPAEDCIACMDLVEMLLVEHPSRFFIFLVCLEQLVIHLICHPIWEVRRLSLDSVRRILISCPQLSGSFLLEFKDYLSLVADRVHILKASDAENSLDAQLQFVPSAEVLVKALLVIPSVTMTKDFNCWKRLFLLAHHSCICTGARKNTVWKDLFGQTGLLSGNPLEQDAALHSSSTLMFLFPKDTFLEFEEYLRQLPDWSLHDKLSENDIQIFRTPEGMLSSEQGVYIAESVADRNVKHAKGRFRMYDDDDDKSDHVKTGPPRETNRREPLSTGKKDPKGTKKNVMNADRVKSAKEEARELLLKEESIVRDKVRHIQSNLTMMLRALGEMAIANPIFAHGQLQLMAGFVNPLMRSPIVNDVAFETMVKLARCIAPPIVHLAPEIAAALRLVATDPTSFMHELVPLMADEEIHGKQAVGLLEGIVEGLVEACKFGPLPVDSFVFIFPILEQILLSMKKTRLHDNVLLIISMHMDPMLPLPRLRMLFCSQVLYHVLGIVPAYQGSIGRMLNELCLGIQPHELASALVGVYAKDAHVRLACLNAVKCIPSVASRSLPQNADVATHIWIALHDREKLIAEVAEDIWDRYGYDFGTDYSGLFAALSHINFNVREAAAEALAAALDENLDSIQETLSNLFSLYIRDIGAIGDGTDVNWLGRQGIALALYSSADVLRTMDLPVVMTFLISRALADPNMDVRARMIDAGIVIVDKHGKDNVSLLFPIFENYLNKKASDEEKYDLVREGVVIFTGGLAKHLDKDDPKVHAVIEKLLDVLSTPSESVQRAVSNCLPPLMRSKQDDAQALVSRLLDKLMHSDRYGDRRGAAFGLAGIVKGLGIPSLKKFGIVSVLREGMEDRNSAKSREGALLGFECLCEKLGRLFEPYVIQILPLLLISFSDQVSAVREAAECAARAMMSHLSGYGVKLVLPSLLKGLEDKAWRTKQSSVQLLGAMAYCAPEQLSQCLPKIVPKLTEVLTDTHPKVQSAGQMALQQVGSVIRNPEISSLVPTLLLGLTDPNEYTRHSLDVLLQTTFVNSVDAPSLALLVPIVHRGLRERSADTKKKAAQIVGNMCSLVTEPKYMIPYIGLLIPEVKKVLVDPIPEVRSVAARALGSLIRGMGQEHFPDLVPWLLDTLKSDSSNVERSGAAQGLSEVLAALGKDYFDQVLPDVIRNCSHPKASVRDGYLTLFKYLPRSLGGIFQNYLQQVLPAILDGLADENESVRDAALSAGHVLVEHYATTSLPLLLPAVEDGIFNDNWRIRQSSVELLGDLLFKVAGTSGKAILEGGSDDEGSSTEAHGRAIIEVLGREKRNEVLAAVYMVRTDVSLSVRQAALHVWKTIVANTPKTLKEIMPVLMNTLISSLASTSSERRQVAGRSLGELVRKLGERVLPMIIPILSQGLKDPNPSRRQGVCVGLSEVMASAGRHQLLAFMDELIPTIRAALCDSMPEVRESAGLAFGTLYKNAGMQAVDEIVPTLLHALEDDETSDTALDGLRQILSAFNAHAIGALAEVAGPGLNGHLGSIIPALLSGMGSDNEDTRTLAKKAGETVALVIDEEGIDPLISELLKALGDSQVYMRSGSVYLIGYFFKNSDLYLVDEAPNIMSTLIVMLTDTDSATVMGAWEALGKVVASVPKEVLPSYIKLVRDAVSTARDKERRKRKGGPIVIPGFCLPKALQPLLPIFLQGLISGSAELREQAAEGLGELVDVTGEKALKEFVVPITGTVRSSAALALGKLSALSTRVDPLVGDLLSLLQASDGGAREAVLVALKGVVKHAGKIVSSPVRSRALTLLKDLIQLEDDHIRSSAAGVLGTLSQYMDDGEMLDLAQTLTTMGLSQSWFVRHGSILTFSSIFLHSPSILCICTAYPVVVSRLKDALEDDKFPIRETANRALGRLLVYQVQSEALSAHGPSELVPCLVSTLRDDSSEVRRRALSGVKAIAKANPSALCPFLTIVGPALAECLKDGNTPVRLAAERCALHVFQLTKGSEHVQASQKYITGLDARRISKLPEDRWN
ncbi:eIF-2-alpha kinase activator [Nymphaea thermarum]|nr:eIF-2-alpha kinase activator [Nymphaea thermarum]